MKIFSLIILFFFFFIFSLASVNFKNDEFIFRIEKGDSFSDLEKNLYKEGIVLPAITRIFFLFFGKDQDLRVGEYLVDKSVSLKDITFNIFFENVHYRTISISEGSKITNFLSKSQIESFCKYKNIPQCNLEGYFHPNTYNFEFFDDFNEVLNTAFNMQLFYLEKYFSEKEDDSIKSEADFLIIASIVEKESCKNEMSLVAGVIYNRLQKKMKLQIDSTVIYGIDNFNGNLTKKDLRRNSVYNSYLNYGLPPTAISNPSEQALKAVAFPDKHDYLYFVKKDKCLHEFSTNYEDHLKAVQKYQLN